MLRQRAPNLIRFGILTLPLAGLLALLGLVGNIRLPDPRTDPEQAARYFSSTFYFVSQFAGNVVGPSLLIFGVIALTAYLYDTRARNLALAGMIPSLLGIALVLSVAGLAAYALPAVGRAYLDGQLATAGPGAQQSARELVTAILGSPARHVFMLVFLLYSAGFVLFGVAIWRSGVLRKGAAISLALHAPLLSSFTRTEPNWASILGALMFIVGGTLISVDVFRAASAKETEATMERRVR